MNPSQNDQFHGIDVLVSDELARPGRPQNIAVKAGRRNPTLATAWRAAEALGIAGGQLFHDGHHEPQPVEKGKRPRKA